jgi:hypothetical protein
MAPSAPKRKRKSEPSTEAAPVINHKEYAHGDFEVISSDNVRFLVPSFHLFSAR